MTWEEILAGAQALLPEGTDTAAFSLIAEDVKSFVCAYCGTEEIPRGAETLTARMIAAAALSGGEGRLKSMTRGDLSFTLENDNPAAFDDFKARLAAFRKLKW